MFSCTDVPRLEVHFFEDEEAAYFYPPAYFYPSAILAAYVVMPGQGFSYDLITNRAVRGASVSRKTFRSTYGTES